MQCSKLAILSSKKYFIEVGAAIFLSILNVHVIYLQMCIYIYMTELAILEIAQGMLYW